MDTILDQYVDTVLQNEIGDQLKQINQLLLENDVDDHLSMVETYISLSGEELEDSEIQDLIIQRLTLEVENIINEFGVGISTLDLNKTPMILRTLLSLEHYDEIDVILTLCDQDGSPEEIFASILHHVHQDVSEEDFFDVLLYVTPSLITRIEKTLTELQENRLNKEVDTDLIKKIAKRVNSFLSNHQAPRFSQLREEGFGLNFKLKTYLDRCVVEEDTAIQIANEYVACALASGKNGSDILVEIDNVLEMYIEDQVKIVDSIQKVRTLINSLGES